LKKIRNLKHQTRVESNLNALAQIERFAPGIIFVLLPRSRQLLPFIPFPALNRLIVDFDLFLLVPSYIEAVSKRL
jgi:hypothetical protein